MTVVACIVFSAYLVFMSADACLMVHSVSVSIYLMVIQIKVCQWFVCIIFVGSPHSQYPYKDACTEFTDKAISQNVRLLSCVCKTSKTVINCYVIPDLWYLQSSQSKPSAVITCNC